MKSWLKYTIAAVLAMIIGIGLGVAISSAFICEECEVCTNATSITSAPTGGKIITTNSKPLASGGWCAAQPQRKCKMICPKPNCDPGTCAERIGECCNYACIAHASNDTTSPDTRIVHGRPLENRSTKITLL